VAQLIVNADDFGLTTGVNRAIAELHQAGVLSSASLMARAMATEDAIQIALATPSLGVGCHVVLVDGEPILPAAAIPHLVTGQGGCLHRSLAGFLTSLFFRWGSQHAMIREIEAEAAAQIDYLKSRGVHLTHIDTHKHLHMFPSVLRAVLRAARASGIRAVRNPFEPVWALRATRAPSWIRMAEVLVLRLLEPACRRIIAEEGFVTTRGTIAVLGTGSLDTAAVTALLSSLQPGVWELVTHPGYNDADLNQVRTRLRQSRNIEREALHAVLNFPEIELVSFDSLQPRENAQPETTESLGR
jgi:hopanoid biosynthesis associated protein HpnK